MFKIILIIMVVAIVFLGLFFYFKTPKVNLENPIGSVEKNLGKILGSSDNTAPDKKGENIIDQTKNSFEKNVDSAKDVAYNKAKSTLDNVFNKTSSNSEEVTVNILGVSNDSNETPYIIDLAKDTSLNINLKINTKYFLKFENIPKNFCLYINDNKYPLTESIVEIQFGKAGNYPIRTNSCDLNDKNIGTLTVQ